jgi:hypothetical protein
MIRPAFVFFIGAILLTGCMDPRPGESQTAEHRMTLLLEPDGPGLYELDVPFIMAHRHQEDRMVVLEEFRDSVRVISGDAVFEWTENRTRFVVSGSGPVVIEANRTFMGDVQEREAFFDWQMTDLEIRRAVSSEVTIRVEWDIDFSAGEGHSCWAWQTFRAVLDAGSTRAVFLPEEETESGSWVGLCA